MGFSFAACEPQLIDGPEPYAAVDSTALAAGITYTQYADKECTQVDTAGNFVKYNSAHGVVQVFSMTGASPLTTGAGGTFKLPVKRGHVGPISMRFRLANADGTLTWATKTFSCTPPAELTVDQILLSGDYGQKVWMYEQFAEAWGNAGYLEGQGAMFDGINSWDSKWWGVEHNEYTLESQISEGIVEGNTATGDEDQSAYMVFDEDGLVQTFTADGKLIRKGGYKLEGYNPTERNGGWELGKLTTSEPAILFPWDVDGNGAVAEFDIMYLTPQDMTLVYTNGQASGGWGTITHWCFIAGSPDPLTMEGTWTYGTNGYGNGGHTGAGAAFNTPSAVDGNWWSVASGDELVDQTHISGGAFGDESSEAYMVFEGNTVTTYAPDGTKIRGGEWEAKMNDYASGAGRGAAGWELGKLTTSEPALLFPWNVDGAGDGVTEYDIMYYDANNMTLVYTNGQASGGWGTITHWCFVRK